MDDSDRMEEAPRPDPGFHIYVDRPDSCIDVTHAVMDVYDIAITSMDFGSGFLSTEEVGHIRALGNAIGAERFDYQNDKCLRCGHNFSHHDSYHDGSECGTCSCPGFIRP